LSTEKPKFQLIIATEMDSKIKKIGVLTSGGDAPGMNAAIRAVVRSAIYNHITPVGIIKGYKGLVDKDFRTMESHSVSKIIELGGTILKSSRLPEFGTDKSLRQKAFDNLKEEGIDALVVIGGDGSFRGANLLFEEFGLPVVGIPGTIDNDIYGTDFTIGFDTAINTAMEAVDKIRDTADSHNEVFLVEVMGRDAGFIAIYTAIATGAEAMIIPEAHSDVESLCRYMEKERRRNKTSGIAIVSEGSELGSAEEIAAQINERLPQYKTKVTTLGHIQRGGSPTTKDRVLASMLGNAAVEALLEGKSGIMVGLKGGDLSYTPFHEACSKHNPVNKKMLEVAKILSI